MPKYLFIVLFICLLLSFTAVTGYKNLDWVPVLDRGTYYVVRNKWPFYYVLSYIAYRFLSSPIGLPESKLSRRAWGQSYKKPRKPWSSMDSYRTQVIIMHSAIHYDILVDHNASLCILMYPAFTAPLWNPVPILLYILSPNIYELTIGNTKSSANINTMFGGICLDMTNKGKLAVTAKNTV